ncbi:MAG: CocE/NonD family hydrolase [Parasporobacterium sp.]|nr:CocE/NonD family hydrolase [Parasporobacterium sp.]
MDNIKITKTGESEIIWKKTKSFDENGDSKVFYTGFNPHAEILPAGWQKRPDRRPLPCDIVFEQDTAIEMRDGIIIRADIFRPNREGTFPAIVSWSPYGKNGSGFEASLDIDGIDMKTLSGLQKFEACDPAFWCNEDYVLVNADSRGSYMSEGDVHFWGTSEGRDAYDATEWIAKQPWSNGKVAFAGNSWLAVQQYFTAAEQPPHLTCIAPWEGHTDLLGDDMCRGGIPSPAFNNMVVAQTPGRGYIEFAPAILAKYPYRNEYWNDKIPAFDRIKVPAYIVASYNSPCHTRGTFEAFRKIASEEKWLRVHNTGEWQDFYEYQDDLKKFFDCFMKDKDNGWKDTPKVRISIIDPGGEDEILKEENEWPPARTELKKLYICEDHQMKETPSEEMTEYRYNADDKKSEMVFSYTFDNDTDIIGYSKLKLFVGTENSDDMDVNVTISKLSAYDTPLVQRGIGNYAGPTGKLRASRRKLDEAVSTENEPVLMLDDSYQFLSKDEVAELDIPIWPTGMRFHAGEKLVVRIVPDVPPLMGPPTEGGSFGAPGSEKGDKAASAETAFAMGAMDGMPPMPPMGGMPPMDGMPPILPGIKEADFDFESMPPADIIPTPPRPGGIHKFYAGGKYQSYLVIPTAKVSESEKKSKMRKIETDILVISAGTAGLAAAVTAAEKGVKAVAVERNGSAGGNGVMANGPFAVESRLQRERMVELTKEEAYKMHMKFTQYDVNGALVKHFIDKSADTIDWLEEMGVAFEGLGRHGHGMSPTWHLVAPEPGNEAKKVNDGYVVINKMKKRAEELGVQILMKTEARKLIMEGGRVVGAIAVDKDGELEIRAKAVISAAGGYGAYWRKPMGIPMYGDGLNMARAVGAEVTDGTMPVITREMKNEKMFGDAPPPFMFPSINAMGGQPNLVVNALGKRFGDEYELFVDPHGFNAFKHIPNGVAFDIFTEDIINLYKKTGFDFIEGYGIRKMGDPISKPDGFFRELERTKELPVPMVYIADTVEELAEKLHIPAENLKKTIETYNTYCVTGRDMDFGKRPEYLRPINGRLYAVRTRMMLGNGYPEGITVDEELRALTPEKIPVPGLYAAGMDCCRSIWSDCYVNILPGNAFGWALNSGRMAAEYASEYVKKYDVQK